ncbi:diguanylate cyclase [Pantoea sp. RIT-PI-b]|uniref:GGDEF domain-containing protein n=1 Tax=unclassified Pantoea TaxID=2630326 RepID=UPI0002714B50|nr:MULTISPECIES: GGDEF domain-containing protein [unclassified Pantoea]EJL87977.1 diguanylate cyclase (GGDEF) domain-containing protein [Pantoea sp. GM01]KNC17443.1 diguanylate cyclase [Pantoea sp. RIT-PI-b]
MRVMLFEENNLKKNTLTLFFITLFFCFIGSHLRIPQEFSLFWPVNALVAGLMVRNPFLHTTSSYLVCFSAMIFNDTVFSGWALPAFTVNFANILFILVSVSMLIKHLQRPSANSQVVNAMRIFPACFLGAAACATWGAWAQDIDFNARFIVAWGDWFSEQFSTSLMLLPVMLARPLRTVAPRTLLHPGKLLPLAAVILSLTVGALIGGAGSLTFPVPALIWCAIVLPIPLTSLVILITGITEIVLVSHGVMNIQGDDALLPISHLTSARLGVATVALSPLLVAVSMDAIRQLNHRLALRANFDFLTQLLSRSGLYESLRNEPFSLQREAGVVMLDVDYFKAINDNFGHDAGDCVLEEIARRIQRVVGNRGMVCRFGGEEFVIVVFDCNHSQLYQLAETVRQAMVKEKFWIQGNTVTVTASLGLARGSAQSEREWPGVINRLVSAADKNLYLAKRNGRNQTSPAMEPRSMMHDVA